jgi:hypothetical protein
MNMLNASNLIAFMPWLELDFDCEVGGVTFIPFRGQKGAVHPALKGVETELATILSSYVDLKGNPRTDCAVATVAGRGWNLDDGEDFQSVNRAASLLFLAAWSENKYYASSQLVNSAHFRIVWQRFQPDVTWTALVTRRRDGRTTDGGYLHGEIKISRPLQCSLHTAAKPDLDLLKAFDKAGDGSPTMARLATALPFVELANTDDDMMSYHAEAILMASAFEQLLDGDGKSYLLVKAFEPHFASDGSVTVEEALSVRPDIYLDPKHEQEQRKWWVHKKWIEEIYRLRNKAAHRGETQGQKWAWNPFEHLVMAAFVFPLVVKRMLEAEGVYQQTDHDIGSGKAIDRLLASTGWAQEARPNESVVSRWSQIVSDQVVEQMWQDAFSAFEDESG